VKKNVGFGLCAAFAVLAALVFSGCPVDEEPETGEKVQITITDLSVPPLPSPGSGSSGSLFFSLSVFEEAGKITNGSVFTKLGGQVCSDWLGLGKTEGSISIPIPRIPNGEYVLVLGASPATSGTGGKMFITGERSGDLVEAKKVSLNFSDGAASVSFRDDFAKKDANSGWEVTEIVDLFGTP
jgi:hypothetical protein